MVFPDRFVDDRKTIPLPSHYFVVLARCKMDADLNNCGENLDLLSFILPQEQPTNNQVLQEKG